MENTSTLSAGNLESRESAPVMSVQDWIIASIVVAIPLVGFIMLFVWAFGDGTNPNKANWAKASLVLMVIGVVFAFLIIMTFGGLAFLNNM